MSVTIALTNYTLSEFAHPEISNVPAFAAGTPGTKSRLLKQVNADDYDSRYGVLASLGLTVEQDGTPVAGTVTHTGVGTIADTTHIAIVTSAGPYTLTLPDASTVGAGFKLWIYFDTDGGDVTCDGSGGDTVLGAANQVLTAVGDLLALVSDGVSNWEAQ